MRGCDSGDGSGCRKIIKEHIPSAVHLKINKARSKPTTGGEMPRRQLRAELRLGQHAFDSGSLQNNSSALQLCVSIEYVVSRDGV
jgi:hypothetical protein